MDPVYVTDVMSRELSTHYVLCHLATIINDHHRQESDIDIAATASPYSSMKASSDAIDIGWFTRYDIETFEQQMKSSSSNNNENELVVPDLLLVIDRILLLLRAGWRVHIKT